MNTKSTGKFSGGGAVTLTPAAKRIETALTAHGVSSMLLRKVMGLVANVPVEDAEAVLSGALSALYLFNPLSESSPVNKGGVRIMLVGAPGAGKTLTAAKLAAHMQRDGRTVRIVTCDTMKSGGIEQLRHFAAPLGLTVDLAADGSALAALTTPDDATLIIDSPGINPYSPADRASLENLAAAAQAEPVLVIAAGGDAADTVETAHVFRDIGCQRFIATRLDIVHRLGSVIAIPEALGIAFAEGLGAPNLLNGSLDGGFTSFSAANLAHLLFAKAGV